MNKQNESIDSEDDKSNALRAENTPENTSIALSIDSPTVNGKNGSTSETSEAERLSIRPVVSDLDQPIWAVINSRQPLVVGVRYKHALNYLESFGGLRGTGYSEVDKLTICTVEVAERLLESLRNPKPVQTRVSFPDIPIKLGTAGMEGRK